MRTDETLMLIGVGLLISMNGVAMLNLVAAIVTGVMGLSFMLAGIITLNMKEK